MRRMTGMAELRRLPHWLRPLGIGLRLLAAGLGVLVLGASPVPGSLVGAVQQARQAAQAGDYTRAAAAYGQAARYQPWQDGWLAARVQAEIQAGAYDQAERDLTLLAARRSLTPDEMLWWGAIYDGQGRTEAAIAAWEQARAAGAVSAHSLEALARAYLDQGDTAQARAILEELARRGTSDAALLERLGMLQAFDSPDQAIATLAQVAALDPDAAHRLVPLFEALDEVSGEPPDLLSARLGVAFLQIGQLETAETAFERAVAYNPVYGEAIAYLAYTRARLGKPALGAAEQAIAVSPQNATVYYLAGQTWKLANRPATARLAFERALELDPANPVYAVEIASTYRLEAQLAPAELWMQEAVRLSGGDFRFRLLLAQFYVDAEYHVPEAGLALAQVLAAEQPASAEAHATLGWAYFLTGHLADAFAELDRALELDATLPRANAHKAALLESQGRLSEAVTYYQRASDFEPDGPFGAFARRALERIGEP